MVDAKAVIVELQRRNIKLVAIDFDNTLIKIHTGGAWQGDIAELLQHVRPCFIELIPQLIRAKIRVGIVTFSKQPLVIKSVLKQIIPKRLVRKIVIRANSWDWIPATGPLVGLKYGKESHIVAVLTEIYRHAKQVIGAREVLLLDDQLENIQAAIAFGHVGLLVDDSFDLAQLCDFFRSELPVPKSP